MVTSEKEGFYVRTRYEGSRLLLFNAKTRELMRIIAVSRLTKDFVAVDGFLPDETPTFSTTLPRSTRTKRVEINIGPDTMVAFFKLTTGARPHAKLGFRAPLTVIILEEEKCRSHRLPEGYRINGGPPRPRRKVAS